MDWQDVLAAGRARVHKAAQRLKGEPRSVQLVSVVEEPVTDVNSIVLDVRKYFHLDKKNLRHVMSQVEPGVPVAIVSVVGAFRSGKSFLLSCFLECLNTLKTNDSVETFEGGILGGKSGRTDGFSWRGGTDPHTQGMTVWSKPFIRDVDDGEGGRTKMAVLLVDTQGTFDHKTETYLEACLFGLSTTLSSCQIFNVKNQVQKDNLGSLAVYLEYGTRAKESQSGGGHDDERPFQRLEVLIRDWQNWENRSDPQDGSCEELRDGFRKYLDHILGKGTTESAKVNGCFRDPIGCFGLPNPGNDVRSLSFDGDINKIDEGFRRLVLYYVKDVVFGKLTTTHVLSPQNGGPDEFVKSVEPIVRLFSDGLTNGKLPDAGSWLSMIHDTYNRKHKEKALQTFKDEMDKHTIDLVDPAKLQTLLGEHKTSTMSTFRPRGNKVTKQDAKNALRHQLEEEAGRIMRANGHLNSSSGLRWMGGASVLGAAGYGLAAAEGYVASVAVADLLVGSAIAAFGCASLCLGVGTFVGIQYSYKRWGAVVMTSLKETFRVDKEEARPASPAPAASQASPAPPTATVVTTAMKLWNDVILPGMTSKTTLVVIFAVLLMHSAYVAKAS